MPEWHIDQWPNIGKWNSPELRGSVNFCNRDQIPHWIAHMTEMMIALDSYFIEDQNQPKDHLIWTSESWFLNLFIHSCILG